LTIEISNTKIGAVQLYYSSTTLLLKAETMVNRKLMKEKLKRNGILIGTHISFQDSSITELIGRVGFDFLWLDMEHTALDRSDIQLHLIAAQAAGVPGIVRIPWNDPILVKPILEMGASGIVFPSESTRKEAEKAVQSCLYPPKGFRGFGPRRAVMYGIRDEVDYIKNSGNEIFKIIQIETKEGVSHLDEIVQVDGIDAVVVGPYDLSGSLGILGEVTSRTVKLTMDHIVKTCQQAGVTAGVSIGGYNHRIVQDWLDRGIGFLSIGVDSWYVLRGAQETMHQSWEQFRKTKKNPEKNKG
jgi:2-keto-3-deoxy-L-rhamnonate aldolase RhmA